MGSICKFNVLRHRVTINSETVSQKIFDELPVP